VNPKVQGTERADPVGLAHPSMAPENIALPGRQLLQHRDDGAESLASAGRLICLFLLIMEMSLLIPVSQKLLCAMGGKSARPRMLCAFVVNAKSLDQTL